MRVQVAGQRDGPSRFKIANLDVIACLFPLDPRRWINLDRDMLSVGIDKLQAVEVGIDRSYPPHLVNVMDAIVSNNVETIPSGLTWIGNQADMNGVTDRYLR